MSRSTFRATFTACDARYSDDATLAQASGYYGAKYLRVLADEGRIDVLRRAYNSLNAVHAELVLRGSTLCQGNETAVQFAKRHRDEFAAEMSAARAAREADSAQDERSAMFVRIAPGYYRHSATGAEITRVSYPGRGKASGDSWVTDAHGYITIPVATLKQAKEEYAATLARREREADETVNEALATAPAYSDAPFYGPSVIYPCEHGACRDGFADCLSDDIERHPGNCMCAPCDANEADPYATHSPDTCPSWGVWCSECGDGPGDNTADGDDVLPVRTAPWDGLTEPTTDPISHALIGAVHGPVLSTWEVLSVHGSDESARLARNATRSWDSRGYASVSGTVCDMRWASDYDVTLTPDHAVMATSARGRTALFSAAILSAANVAGSGMGLPFGTSVHSRTPSRMTGDMRFSRYRNPYAQQAYAGTPAPAMRHAGSLPFTAYVSSDSMWRTSRVTRAVSATAVPALDLTWCEDCQESMIGAVGSFCESCDVACDRCGSHASEDDRCSVGDETWCQYCTDRNATYLDCCSEYASIRDSSFTRCNRCESTVCDSCGYTSCYECDRSLCSGCSDRCECGGDDYESHGGGLADSCAAPPMTFRGTGAYHLGIELEIAGVPGYVGGDINSSDLRTHLVAKTDGSVDGVEFAFSPMTLDYLRTWDGLSELLSTVRDYARDSSGAGIHCHVSREAFTSTDHMQTFGALLGSDVNAHRVSQYARRSGSTWAQFRSLTEISDAISSPAYSPRYSAVNWSALSVHGTAEVRVFRSSIDHETIIGTAALVAAAVEFTREHVDSLVGMDWDEFGAWCLTREDFHIVAAEILRTLPVTS